MDNNFCCCNIAEEKTIMDIKTHISKLGTNDLHILLHVCNIYGVQMIDLLGTRRKRELVEARKMASYYFRRVCNYSLTRIAHIIGVIPKDHTTIIYYVDHFEHYMKHEEETRSKFSLLLFITYKQIHIIKI